MDRLGTLSAEPLNGAPHAPPVNVEYEPDKQAKPAMKVAIVGKAPSSLMLAPYDNPEWEVWGLSTGAQMLPRWSRWFELHDLDEGFKRWPEQYRNWLAKDHGKPVYINAPHAAAPFATVYPRDEIIALSGTRYFTNSIAWMIALAVAEGATEIGVYGVDMAQSDPVMGANGEYQHQRPSCEYIIGWAQGRGVKVTIPDESDLLKTPRLYGFESDIGRSNRKHKARAKELHDQLAAVRKDRRTLKEQDHQLELREHVLMGAIDDNEYWGQRV